MSKKEDIKKEEDVAMKDVAVAVVASEGDKTKEQQQPSPLEAAAWRLEKSLSQKDQDYYSNPAKIVRRWLSTSSGAAASATFGDIAAASQKLLDPSSAGALQQLLLLPEEMVVDSRGTDAAAAPLSMIVDTTAEETNNNKSYLKAASSEVLIWLLSLKVRLLWRSGTVVAASQVCESGIVWIQTTKFLDGTSSSSTSLYPLLARLWRWFDLCATPATTPASASSIRSAMAQAHNMALLRRDVDTAATLLNGMLRDLLQHSQVEQAQKLLSNSTFPDTATNNQLCRYLYYSGRIQALRLEYTSSYSNLSQSLRKAPTNTALGFRIAVQRLLIVVQLLMGDIPDRPVFYQTGMKLELQPYLEITQAVRHGDLAVFTKVVSRHKQRLQDDQTYTLISRLAHQVVKAGLRKLQVSYSRLSLQDVADRLGLANAKQAEFVVAKAVRDGVLDATIHHKEGYVQSHDLQNVYATKEPAHAFHRRIAYCLTTHNDAVRAMRYPPDAYKKQLEASRGYRRKRGDADKSDEEKAQELEDELEEDY